MIRSYNLTAKFHGPQSILKWMSYSEGDRITPINRSKAQVLKKEDTAAAAKIYINKYTYIFWISLGL